MIRVRHLLTVGLTLGLAACSDELTSPQTQIASPARLGLSANAGGGDVYIVALNDSVTDVPGIARRLSAAHGGKVRRTYKAALHGFSLSLPAGAAEALRRNPRVKYVEADLPVALADDQYLPMSNVERLDHRLASEKDSYYSYYASGSGVNAYILDSGINAAHWEFGYNDGSNGPAGFSRVRSAYSVIQDGFGTEDCHTGHGSHVAGIVGAETYGVAKGVTLHSVRIADCGGAGSTEGVINAIDWVVVNHVSPAVANLSLVVRSAQGEETTSDALDDAVRRMISAGVTTVIAAGNTNKNACFVSPARVAEAITVGSIGTDVTSEERKALTSNYGSCVDVWAYGYQISSVLPGSINGSTVRSGTSFAAPHAAGVAAMYLEGDPTASPATVASALINNATMGALVGITPNFSNPSYNRLLYSSFISDPNRLTVSVTGESNPGANGGAEGFYRYYAVPTGGEPGAIKTYKWEILYLNTGVSQVLGYKSSHTIYVAGTDGPFQLKVTVQTPSRTGYGIYNVNEVLAPY